MLKSGPLVRRGDTVYVVSPSAGLLPFAPNRVERAISNMEKLGVKVKIARHAAENAGYVSASVDDRVSDLHEAFSDKKCSLIIASIGGNHSNQLVKHLDYELIKNNPKSFVGYSDNTVLHYALAGMANLQTYYGPCFLNQFGEYPGILPFTLNHFTDLLFDGVEEFKVKPPLDYTDELLDWFKDEDSKRPRKLYPNIGLIWWRKGAGEGRALPGAIPSLNHLISTPYAPNFLDSVLMIDIPEGNTIYEGLSVADADSWLTDLDNAGLLAQINGMVISRPYRYNNEMVEELRKVVLRIVDNYNFPVVFNLDFGHTDPMITVPIYANVKLDSSRSLVSVSHKISAE